MTENEISTKVIGFAIEIHKTLGPGLLEKAYQECLYFELAEAGLKVEKEKILPVTYKGVTLNCGYKIDLLVEEKVVIEIKSVEAMHDIYTAQTLTYLKLGNYKLGLLINFKTKLLKNGITRLINGKFE